MTEVELKGREGKERNSGQDITCSCRMHSIGTGHATCDDGRPLLRYALTAAAAVREGNVATALPTWHVAFKTAGQTGFTRFTSFHTIGNVLTTNSLSSEVLKFEHVFYKVPSLSHSTRMHNE